jgi:hypothetical protein
MKRTVDRPELSWFLVETGDRWYRAVCRFAPSMLRNQTVSRIIRIQPPHASGLVSRVKGINGLGIVLWTISDGNKASDAIEILDWISMLRTEAPAVYQVAATSPSVKADWFLAAQEAGIGSFLESTERLPSLETRIQRRMDAFG